jgi:Na+/melibiose symporter-like transporter
MPLMQKVSYDTGLRTKWTKLMRIWVIVIMVPVYFYIPLVTAVNAGIGDFGRSFSLVCVVLMIILGVVSFVGLVGLKEPRTTVKGEDSEKLKLREILSMFAKNKPLLIQCLATVLSNMVFSLSSAVSVYFLKWYYAADLATGVVDAEKYAAIYGIYALAGLIPNFIGPFIAGRFIKKSKTYARAAGKLMMLGVILYSVLSALFFTGILRVSPYLYIVLIFGSGLITGTAVIPATLLWTESADYAEWKTGKKMSAMINSFNNMTGKAQAALSAAITGSVLIAVGYSVDSVSGNYSGDLSQLPGMINGFGIFLTVVPVVVMLLTWALYRFFYPITPEIQQEMLQALEKSGEDAQ